MNPAQLHTSQSSSFTQNGFTVRKDCFNSEHAEAIKAASAKLLGDSNLEANNWINAPHAASSTLREALLHKPWLDALESLIGAHFVCWGSSLLCKWPQTASAVNWHQDAGYWPLQPAATVTAWIAVDEATLLNGCLSVIPGSHRNGPLPYDDTEPGAHAFGLDSSSNACSCAPFTSSSLAPPAWPAQRPAQPAAAAGPAAPSARKDDANGSNRNSDVANNQTPIQAKDLTGQSPGFIVSIQAQVASQAAHRHQSLLTLEREQSTLAINDRPSSATLCVLHAQQG